MTLPPNFSHIITVQCCDCGTDLQRPAGTAARVIKYGEFFWCPECRQKDKNRKRNESYDQLRYDTEYMAKKRKRERDRYWASKISVNP